MLRVCGKRGQNHRSGEAELVVVGEAQGLCWAANGQLSQRSPRATGPTSSSVSKVNTDSTGPNTSCSPELHTRAKAKHCTSDLAPNLHVRLDEQHRRLNVQACRQALSATNNTDLAASWTSLGFLGVRLLATAEHLHTHAHTHAHRRQAKL